MFFILLACLFINRCLYKIFMHYIMYCVYSHVSADYSLIPLGMLFLDSVITVYDKF